VTPTTIVCSIDFAAADTSALAYGLALARWHDAELHVVHVRPGARGAGAAAADPYRGRIVRAVKALGSEGVRFTAAVVPGDPPAAVAGYARDHGAQLIVAGQHGRRGSGYWSAGAFATALARAADCPVVVVPAGAAPPRESDTSGPFHDIVCAIDFSHSSIGALNTALALAQGSAGRLTLLHVLDPYPGETIYGAGRAVRFVDEHRRRVERTNGELRLQVPPQALDWCEIDAETVSGTPHDAIVAAAKARHADLIVLGHRRRPRLEQIVSGSTVRRVLRRAPCPVLIVPESSAASVRPSQQPAEYSGEADAPALAGVAAAR
jgi:nucleotide-binding universal stress UspA family protein